MTARIAEVTLPTGGTITYTYNKPNVCGNCMMADGSPSTMTRTLGGGQWQYARALQSGQQLPQTTTTITDPSSNVTNLKFYGIYETERTVNQGSSTVLDYSYVCYNGNTTSCSTAIVNAGTYINERKIYDFPNYASGSKYSIQDYLYDQYGNMTLETDYDYATSNNLVVRGISIETSGESSSPYHSLCTGLNICDHPSTLETTDGTNIKGETTYAYDAKGNPTLVRRYSFVGSPGYPDYVLSYNTDGTRSDRYGSK